MDTLTVVLFYLLAAITGASAIAVVVTQNIVRAATWLLFTLAGTAGIFFLLGADFIGATQLMALPSQKPRAADSSAGAPKSDQRASPLFQPPRNSDTAMPLTANMAPYSAMKKKLQRRPEYSVWKPATSSLSASARSKGARLHDAVAQVK